MPDIDVVDSTWLAAPAGVIGPIVADPANWRRWWPGLRVRVDEWRQEKGVRWLVDAVAGAEHLGLHGTGELWLESMYEGVVAHFFLRLDVGAGQQLSRRRRERVIDTLRQQTKDAFWTLAAQLDPGRVERHTSTSVS